MDDYFDWRDMSDTESDIYSLDSWQSNKQTKLSRKEQHKAKMMDKGYYYYYSKSNNNQRPYKIEMYDSGNSLGYRIRDPMTGARMNARVGSKEELGYFKVRYCGLNPYNPVTLFYDCPEHYERHHKTTLSDEIKEKWWRENRSMERPTPLSDENKDMSSIVIPGTCEEVPVTVIH